jgi:spore coat protein CotH
VPTFDLVLPPEQWVTLQQNARDEEYVSAEACFEGRSIGTIGMRFKGSYGSLYGCFDERDQLICPRLSMKLDFDRYVEDQRFYGLKRLSFHAYRHDDSRMKERLAYDLYRAMGVVAPRAAWAVLRVNGESLGLYGMVEQLDGRFTNDRWPATPDGNLYKELWPTVTDPVAVAAALETNEETGDVSPFLTFSETFTSANEEELLPTLAEFMDLDYLARYMAVDDAVASYDGVTYFWTDGVSNSNHNFYIYEEGPEKYWLIPWDVESTFWINPDHAAPHWTQLPDDCSTTYPYWEGLASAPACDVFFRALNQDQSRWRAASQELLDGPFALDAMLATIDRHEAFIAAEAHVDPTPAMYVPFDDAVANLRVTVPALRTRLQALIATEPE